MENKKTCMYTAYILSLEEPFSIAVGESKTLRYSLFPDDGSTITWQSSDSTVVSVSDSGIIMARKAGKATITASVGDVSTIVQVTVYTPATDLFLSANEIWLAAKDSIQLSVLSLVPSDAFADIIWTSSDQSLANADKNGNLLTYKPGDVLITATTEKGVSKSSVA